MSADIARIRSKPGRIWQKSHRTRSTSQILGRQQPTCFGIRINIGRNRPNWDDTEQGLAEVGARFGRTPTDLVESRPSLAEVEPNSAEVAQIFRRFRVMFGLNQGNLGRLDHIEDDVGQLYNNISNVSSVSTARRLPSQQEPGSSIAHRSKNTGGGKFGDVKRNMLLFALKEQMQTARNNV